MKNILAVALLSAFVAGPAVAADTYVGVNVGSAQIDSPGFDSSKSLGLLGGYSFNESFAAEVAYIDFGSESGGGITSKSSAVSISGVVSLPINKQFAVFSKLGLASTTYESQGDSESKSDLTFGVGGQFNVNKQVGIRAGYDLYKVGSPDTVNQRVVSVGAVFKF